MGSTFDRLCADQLITDAPSHMKNNVHYECIMGSTAYGVSDDTSDVDIYGFCMPPKHILFPYNSGNIVGFGDKPENFKQYQKHHILDKNRRKEYDISIYNIVKFFQLCMENNPNMVDALYVPTRCILHSTAIGEHVRENRNTFLSKRAWHKFKGYAFSQLHKMKSKAAKEWVDLCKLRDWDLYVSVEELRIIYDPQTSILKQALAILKKIESNGKRTKRLPSIAKYGYDVKFAYHVVRLVDECEQILAEQDLDLTRSREHLKAIRRGEWTMEQIEDYFNTKAITLESLYASSDLRYSPEEDDIRNLLFECIEMHYGSVEKMGVKSDDRILKHLVDANDALQKAMRMM